MVAILFAFSRMKVNTEFLKSAKMHYFHKWAITHPRTEQNANEYIGQVAARSTGKVVI